MTRTQSEPSVLDDGGARCSRSPGSLDRAGHRLRQTRSRGGGSRHTHRFEQPELSARFVVCVGRVADPRPSTLERVGDRNERWWEAATCSLLGGPVAAHTVEGAEHRVPECLTVVSYGRVAPTAATAAFSQPSRLTPSRNSGDMSRGRALAGRRT